MRRIMLSLMAMSIIAAPAVLDAQTPERQERHARIGPAGAMDPAARVLALRERLGLTADQVASIEAIQARYRARNEPLIQQLREAMPEQARLRLRAAEGRDLAQEQRERIRHRMEELTPEQREELRQRMQERRGEQRQRMREMTPEQREEMRQRMRKRSSAMQERAQELRPVMEQLRANHQQALGEVREVLTPDQRATLESIREERMQQMHERRGERGDRQGRRGQRGQT